MVRRMNPAELDVLLQHTLADRKLSGSEKQALAGFVQKSVTTDVHRGTARSRAFEIARIAVADDDARRVLTWLEDVLKVLTPVVGGPVLQSESEAFFSPGDTCLGQIVHRFGAARRSVDICVFTITDDRVTRAILDARRRGVAIRLITDNEKANDLGSDIERIAAAGIEVRIDHTPFHMHNKFAIFDETHLLNGSYNWTRGAAEQNQENLIDTADPNLIRAFRREFDKLWTTL